MKKRNVFDELVQGFDDLKAEGEGKITLKSTAFAVLLAGRHQRRPDHGNP